MTAIARSYAVLLFTLGALLLVGGIWLATIGGSPYYLIAGTALMMVAWRTWMRDARAATGFAIVLVVTAGWALAEVGTAAWPLFGRLFALSVLGLPLVAIVSRQRRANQVAMAVPWLFIALIVLRLLLPPQASVIALPTPIAFTSDVAGEQWSSWGGDAGGLRYSTLSEITPDNVAKLVPAWDYRTGIPADGKLGNLEVTPIAIGDRLYLCNNMSMVDALDPDTGRRLWRFDPRIDVTGIANRTCRGVAFAKAGSGICAERIIVATLDAALWALDAKTGRACAGFGVGGRVDLSIGMGNISGGYYYPTSAPTIVRDKIIIGVWVTDGQRTQSPPGVVRAYDLKRGTLAWSWDIGRPGVTTAPRGTATYVAGTPNVWAPPSSDEALGLVFLPTGNAGPDYFNPERSAAAEYFASSVVALDATTGVVRWRFQTVHHDVWDYDVGSQPTLVDIPLHGRSIPALVQATKRGQIFVLDRRTGRPVVPVIERAVPQRRYLNEQLSPTQPFSAEPSVAGPLLTEASMWGLTPLDQLWCRIRFRQARYEGEMTPPGLMPSIEYPGFMGAVSWGSIAIDPRRSVAIVNATRMPTWHRLVPRAEADRLGLRPRGEPGAKPRPGYWPQLGVAFAVYAAGFLSPLGVPCSAPPYGTLSAIDLRKRQILWERPFGSARDSGPFGLRSGLPLEMGVPNAGGAIVTASGLIFIAATQTENLHALSLADGRTLWQSRLPAGGQATPMTFRSVRTGRQYVVVAAGGKSLLRTRLGDHLLAYRLP